MGRRIRKLRLARKWRQIDLANAAGISRNHISAVELGNSELGLNNLAWIAKAFGLKMVDLVKDLD
jgi:transcriptional regulator with XRE-family HTH domain